MVDLLYASMPDLDNIHFWPSKHLAKRPIDPPLSRVKIFVNTAAGQSTFKIIFKLNRLISPFWLLMLLIIIIMVYYYCILEGGDGRDQLTNNNVSSVTLIFRSVPTGLKVWLKRVCQNLLLLY